MTEMKLSPKTKRCTQGHCLCGAGSTAEDPPEVGRRVQAYGDRWEFITWHNGDQQIFTHWRPDLESSPCSQVKRGL